MTGRLLWIVPLLSASCHLVFGFSPEPSPAQHDAPRPAEATVARDRGPLDRSADIAGAVDQRKAPDQAPAFDKGKAPDQAIALDKGKAPDKGIVFDKGKAPDKAIAFDKGKPPDKGTVPDGALDTKPPQGADGLDNCSCSSKASPSCTTTCSTRNIECTFAFGAWICVCSDAIRSTTASFPISPAFTDCQACDYATNVGFDAACEQRI